MSKLPAPSSILRTNPKRRELEMIMYYVCQTGICNVLETPECGSKSVGSGQAIADPAYLPFVKFPFGQPGLYCLISEKLASVC